MHKVYYQPEGIWVGDIMPYGEDGTFYLYHQRDTRNPEPFGEPFGWALATTKDFVNYKDFGESLERGGDEEVDQYVYAGTVFKVGDKYHALYTGCNRDKVRARLMKQVLLHATSDDAVKWEKNIAETLLPPQEGYDDRNWRDPFVLWDEENEEYMLILGTRVGEDKRLMTGRLVKFTSKDLTNWEFQGDWWNPGLYTMFEMPDLFKMGDWWYLITTEYSHASTQVYRMAKSLKGPWIAPDDDAFDGRAYYAGRTFMLNNQRILFGWVPTRANETDSANLWYRPEADKEDFIWAGTFVAHELYQRKDGTLGCRIPDTVWNAFKDEKKLDDVKMEKESGRALQHVVTKTGDCYRYEADVTFAEGTRGFSIGVRAQEADDEFYSFTFECPKDRVIFEKSPNWPWPQMNNMGLERLIRLVPGKKYHVQIIVDDTIATLYVDGVALNTRMYTKPGEGICLGVTDGSAVFENQSIAYL